MKDSNEHAGVSASPGTSLAALARRVWMPIPEVVARRATSRRHRCEWPGHGPPTTRILVALAPLLLAGSSATLAPAGNAGVTDPPRPDSAPQSAEAATLDDVIAAGDIRGTPPGPAPGGALPESAAPPGEVRPLPDFDGRGPPPPTLRDALVWPPRVIFYPIHLTLEWTLRQPLLAVLTFVDQHHVYDRVVDFFTWDERRAALFPVVELETGAMPLPGLSFFWKELGPDGAHHVTASASGWGEDRLALRGGHRVRLSGGLELLLGVTYLRRPDNRVWPTQQPNDRCVLLHACGYRSAVADTWAGLRSEDEHTRWEGVLRYRDAELGRDGAPPRLTHEAAELPGLDAAYQLVQIDLSTGLDTRAQDVLASGSGLALELFGTAALAPAGPALRFVRYGARAAGYWDLGGRHVISVHVATAHLANLSRPDGVSAGSEAPPVPLTEEVALGGDRHMRAFSYGLLRGHHAWTAALEYRYSIHFLVDALLFVEIGNASETLAEWSPRRSYLSYGLALRTSSERDVALQVLLGLASDRLDDPHFELVNETRLTAGIIHGF